MSSTRDQIIEKTCELLEAQGYHATGLNQILAESGAPKGSLYYYFPAGKEELTAEAINRTGRYVAERIKHGLTSIDDPIEAIQSFICTIAYHVETSGFRSGGPLMIVAMETAIFSERLNGACREAYALLQRAFQEKLQSGGYAEEQAVQLATFIVSAVEGGIILSRTRHSGDPLRTVANMLGRLLPSFPKAE
ncbi:MAG TPA: TetR/AcrR family transcriptional regulator [Ktedonobacteraceae bacterium]|nr:TetR/AcrR family transcriptional regulator [Ktedonobacteraceae bacterium]